MTTQELVNGRKEDIRRLLKGCDNILKLSGTNSYIGMIEWVDKQNPNISNYNKLCESLWNKVTSMLRMAYMRATRTHNKRLINWIEHEVNNSEMIRYIREYMLLHNTIFTIDYSTVSEFTEHHKEDGMYKNIIRDTDKEDSTEFILRYKNTLYHVLIPSIKSLNNSTAEIRLNVCTPIESLPRAVYDYSCIVNSVDTKMNPIVEAEKITVKCTNISCEHYKNCENNKSSSIVKEVNCNPQLCNECDAFKDDIVPPYKLLEVIKPVVYAYDNRTQSSRVINEGAPVHYEPLPLPESNKDIVIYSDTECKHEEIIRIVNHDENYIPGTHASPREHERKAHYRYNRKTGLKDIRVRGCTVNKGHTKTSYVVKKHNNSIKEATVK